MRCNDAKLRTLCKYLVMLIRCLGDRVDTLAYRRHSVTDATSNRNRQLFIRIQFAGLTDIRSSRGCHTTVSECGSGTYHNIAEVGCRRRC